MKYSPLSFRNQKNISSSLWFVLLNLTFLNFGAAGRSAGRSYIPSDIGTDMDDEDVGICPDNPEEDADAIHLLQVKAICVDEAGEASCLSRFIGVVLFKVWKVFANNEADVVKEPGKEGGLYCPYISFNGGMIGSSKMSMRRTFQSRQ